MINENEDPRFFKDWRENEKFVNALGKLFTKVYNENFLNDEKIDKKFLNKIYDELGSDLRLFYHNRGFLKNLNTTELLKNKDIQTNLISLGGGDVIKIGICVFTLFGSICIIFPEKLKLLFALPIPFPFFPFVII